MLLPRMIFHYSHLNSSSHWLQVKARMYVLLSFGHFWPSVSFTYSLHLRNTSLVNCSHVCTMQFVITLTVTGNTTTESDRQNQPHGNLIALAASKIPTSTHAWLMWSSLFYFIYFSLILLSFVLFSFVDNRKYSPQRGLTSYYCQLNVLYT